MGSDGSGLPSGSLGISTGGLGLSSHGGLKSGSGALDISFGSSLDPVSRDVLSIASLDKLLSSIFEKASIIILSS
jgi:hypothetical protein